MPALSNMLPKPPPVADPSLGDKDPWIYKKGPAFGVPGVHVDGMDVLKVGWRGVVGVRV